MHKTPKAWIAFWVYFAAIGLAVLTATSAPAKQEANSYREFVTIR